MADIVLPQQNSNTEVVMQVLRTLKQSGIEAGLMKVFGDSRCDVAIALDNKSISASSFLVSRE